MRCPAPSLEDPVTELEQDEEAAVPVPSHYDILGVPRTASTEEIRRAYHAQARRWHPDHAADRPAADAGRGDDAMRRINEAWRVLGDAQRRRDYDRSMVPGGATSAASAGAAWATPGDAAPRIDPRLLDPDYLAFRRDQQFVKMDRRQAVVLRVMPLVALLVLLAAIVIVTAYARPRPQAVAPPPTAPVPGIGVAAGACVRIATGPTLLDVPCDGSRDGVVLGVREEGPESRCPPRTFREVPLPNGAIVCLAP